MMIVIIGATGTIGSEVLKRLADLGMPARALSREPEKLLARHGAINRTTLEIASADASDPESLRRAFAGANQLFLAMSNSPKQVELETAVIRAAVQAGIEHIVKISSPAFDPKSPVTVAKWHQEAEHFLFKSGIACTALRPYAFMQNLLRHAPSIAAQHVFYGSMGDTSCNFIDCRDIAEVAVQTLIRPELAGQVYTLTGSELFSYPQIAAKLSVLLGRTVRYINMDPEALRRDLIQYGHMPPWLADHVVEIQTMSIAIPEKPTDTIARLLGKAPRTLDEFLREHAERFQ